MEAKKVGEDQAIGWSTDGLSTKIHALVNVLGNPTAFNPTLGQTCYLTGADSLLPSLKDNTLLADKAYDANARVIEPLRQAGKPLLLP